MKKIKPLIVANWKMNPETYKEAEEIFAGSVKILKKISASKLVLCLPYTWLTDFSHKYKKVVSFGAQDAAIENVGPHTGEISPNMLASSDVEYVILGHSERRAQGETDELIAKKILASIKSGLKVILCIGENERDGHGEYLHFLRNQIAGSLSGISSRHLKDLIIAYEPVWAIGKGEDEAMKPTDLHETSIFIKKVLSEIYSAKSAVAVPVLYGGSVNHKNAKELLNSGEVQGLLVGRESLDPKKFESLLLSLEN